MMHFYTVDKVIGRMPVEKQVVQYSHKRSKYHKTALEVVVSYSVKATKLKDVGEMLIVFHIRR